MNWQVFQDASAEAFEDLKEHPLLPVVSILSLALYLFSLAACIVAYKAAQSLFPDWASESKAVLHLKHETNAHERESLIAELRKWPEIETLTTESREEAMRDMRNQLGEWSGILDGFRENPFPFSVEIHFKERESNSSKVENQLERLRQFPQVAEVFHGKLWLDKLEPFSYSLKFLAMSVLALLTLMTLIVAFLTTSSSIANRINEMEISKLVGATHAFIQLPFYIKVVLTGIAGSTLANVALIYAFWTLGGLFSSADPLPFHWKPSEIVLLMAGITAWGVAIQSLGCCFSFIRNGPSLR